MAWAAFPAIPPAPPVRRAIGQRTGLRPVRADVGIRPYMHALPFSIVGAHFICARAAPPVRRRLARKRSCPTGGHKGRPYAVVLTWCVGRGAHTPPNQAAGTTMAPGRRGPAMAACGHTALRGSAGAWRESGAFSGGYIIRPYMHALPFPAVGAHFICARTAPQVCRRLARKRSCPTGGHTGRPYAVFFTWCVGRGAHTPPNQAAMAACGHAALQGSAGAWRESGAFSGGYIIRPYMHALPFPAVGAHFICARTAPQVCRRLARKRSCPTGGHTGRPYAVFFTWCVGRGAHTPPNQAAMAACGHAALQGSAGAWRESGAFSGGYIIRPYMHALPFPAVGAHFICARTAPQVCRRLARKRSCPTGGHTGRPYAVFFTWCVGRGAHTPPNQAAGTTMAPGRRGPAMAACGHTALRGSAGARRESGAFTCTHCPFPL